MIQDQPKWRAWSVLRILFWELIESSNNFRCSSIHKGVCILERFRADISCKEVQQNVPFGKLRMYLFMWNRITSEDQFKQLNFESLLSDLLWRESLTCCFSHHPTNQLKDIQSLQTLDFSIQSIAMPGELSCSVAGIWIQSMMESSLLSYLRTTKTEQSETASSDIAMQTGSSITLQRWSNYFSLIGFRSKNWFSIYTIKTKLMFFLMTNQHGSMIRIRLIWF